MNRRHFLKDTLASFELIGVSRLPELKEGLASLGSQAHPSSGGEIDLSKAAVVVPRDRSARERKAVQVVVEEVERRAHIRWPVVEELKPQQSTQVIVGSSQALRQNHSRLERSPDCEWERYNGTRAVPRHGGQRVARGVAQVAVPDGPLSCLLRRLHPPKSSAAFSRCFPSSFRVVSATVVLRFATSTNRPYRSFLGRSP